MTNDQKQAALCLSHGGIVIYPTDTAYGIGCRIDDYQAVTRLFALKNRDPGKAVPVLAASAAMAASFWQKPLPATVTGLTEKCWPGALTIIYYAKKTDYHPSLYGPLQTLGFRVPDRLQLQEIIAYLGVPVIGTSANFAGNKAPHEAGEIDPALASQVDFVLNGSAGSGVSTVVDLTDGIKVVRQGNIRINL